jgi:Uma2 family endonuclease
MNRPGELFRHEGAAPARFTAAEFLRMADLGAFDDMKVELDHGELVRMNPPHGGHGMMQASVIAALARGVSDPSLVVCGEVGVALGPDTVRAFDAALVRGPLDPTGLITPGQIVIGVEISESTLERDLGEKLRDYAAAGTALYWVVDVQARVVHVMTGPNGETYDRRAVVRFGEPLALPDGGTITLG